MTNTRTYKQSFNGGEVTPEFFGFHGDPKFQNGVAKMRNFIAMPHGPAMNRPGSKYINECKDVTATIRNRYDVRLIPFVYNDQFSFVIEMGHKYFRFYYNGSVLLCPTATAYNGATAYVVGDLVSSGGVNYYCIAATTGNAPPNTTYWYAQPSTGEYEIPHPVGVWNLADVNFVQSNDVITFTHIKHNPFELRRYGNSNWQVANVSFSTPISAPTGVTATATVGLGGQAIYYVVTALAANGRDESVASSSANCTNDLYVSANYNTISWSSVSGASRYKVYKRSGGLYGFIGSTTGTSIIDDNITADISQTPPEYSSPFTKAGAITAVAVGAGGAGYPSTYSGGVITAVEITDFGAIKVASNTSPPFTMTVSDWRGSGATFTFNSTLSFADRYGNGQWYWRKIVFDVTTGGTLYEDPVFSLINEDTGQGVRATFNPTITAIVQNVTLTVSDVRGGQGAELIPNIVAGALSSITVVNGGYGYVSPTVTITTTAGAGAAIGAITVNADGDYPGACSYFEQRRVFAGTEEKPQTFWGTKTGTESNLSYSYPTKDDDRIEFKIASREANRIKHIVPLQDMIMLTSSAEWKVGGAGGEPITPSSINVRTQSYVGASNVQPVVINNNLVFCAARGGHVRELGYNYDANGYVTGDLSLRSPHLFDGLSIKCMAYQKAPFPVIWMVNSLGRLIGLTYVPEQNIGGWHWHDTDGVYQSVCVVPEGQYDRVYVVVKRKLDGVWKAVVERFDVRNIGEGVVNSPFMDCYSVYSGAATTSITGLDYLEGKEVAVLADGAVHPRRTVTSGAITLDNEASIVYVGLPITADIETLPVSIGTQDGTYGQGRVKNVNKVWLRVHKSGGIFCGPDFSELVEVKQRTEEIYGQPPELKSQEIEILIPPKWSDSGRVCIRQEDPLPLTVVSATYEVAIGG